MFHFFTQPSMQFQNIHSVSLLKATHATQPNSQNSFSLRSSTRLMQLNATCQSESNIHVLVIVMVMMLTVLIMN